MRTRNIIKNPDGTYNIVWFGSAGVSDVNQIDEEVAVYSITRENFLCNEFPLAVCGITSVTTSGGVITSITIKSTYPRSKNQGASFMVDGVGTIHYLFQEVDENDTVINNLVEGDVVGSVDTDIAFTMSATNYILLTLSGLGVSNYINELELKYRQRSGSKIPADNYIIDNQEMVGKSLTQRLAVIKGELYYNLNYGLPLLDKIRDKAIIDIEIINIINKHPAVVKINSFSSSVIKENKNTKENNVYQFTVDVLTVYNKSVTISSNYSI